LGIGITILGAAESAIYALLAPATLLKVGFANLKMVPGLWVGLEI